MKLIYIDTETTGLYPNVHGIHQLAGIVEIDGEVKKEFNYFIRPFANDKIEFEALKVSNSTEQQIMRYAAPDLIYKEFVEMLSEYVSKFDKQDKFFIVAYNAKFDVDFLRAFFRKNNDNYFNSWFWSANIDVMSIAAFYFSLKKEKTQIESFKLESICRLLGVDLYGNFHTAADDIRFTRELYKEFCARLGVLDGISARY